MKIEITIEQLAPYLPYGLNFYRPYLIYSGGENPQPDHEEWGEDEVTIENFKHVLDSGMPLLLHPLSDLTIDYLVDGVEDVTNYLSKNDINKIVSEKMPLYYIPYGQFLRLVSWHFDVFGLIEKGLAIDINTL